MVKSKIRAVSWHVNLEVDAPAGFVDVEEGLKGELMAFQTRRKMLMTVFLVFFAFKLFSPSLGAPTELVGWTNTYGGTSFELAGLASSVVQSSDGGFALAGYTYSFGAGGGDFWLVKTDSSGSLLWNKTYGDEGYEVLYSVLHTEDEGYALAGCTTSYGAGANDFWLVKTDSEGRMMWNTTYGGPYNDFAEALLETLDGGYALGGRTMSSGAGETDIFIVKVDDSGNAQWSKTFGSMSTDFTRAFIQTLDGGYMIAGNTNSFSSGDVDLWMIKLNANGDPQWNRTYGGSNDELVNSVIQTGDGGFIVAGRTKSYRARGADFWMIKLNANGDPQWNQTYGGPYNDNAFSVIETVDGYVLTGAVSISTTVTSSWLLKTDFGGNMLWNRTYGGPENDYTTTVVATDDGGYILAGHTESYGNGDYDLWLIKTDSAGYIPELPSLLILTLLTTGVLIIASEMIKRQNTQQLGGHPSNLRK